MIIGDLCLNQEIQIIVLICHIIQIELHLSYLPHIQLIGCLNYTKEISMDKWIMIYFSMLFISIPIPHFNIVLPKNLKTKPGDTMLNTKPGSKYFQISSLYKSIFIKIIIYLFLHIILLLYTFTLHNFNK